MENTPRDEQQRRSSLLERERRSSLLERKRLSNLSNLNSIIRAPEECKFTCKYMGLTSGKKLPDNLY